jgi:hypothetical protein
MWRGKAEGANFRRPWRPTARSLSGVAAVADARDLPGPGRDDDEVGVLGDGGVGSGDDADAREEGGSVLQVERLPAELVGERVDERIWERESRWVCDVWVRWGLGRGW